MSTTAARFLSWRYYTTKTTSKPLSVIHAICFTTIALSTFVLTLTLAIIKGFEIKVEERMQSIYPPLVLYAPEYEAFDFKQLTQELTHSHPHLIKALAPAHIKQVIICHENQEPVVITLKGVNPFLESLVSPIESTLIHKNSLAQCFNQHNSIIIGQQLAQHFNVTIGDRLKIFFSDTTHFTENQSFSSCSLHITNIMNTGIMEYDYSTALVSLTALSSIFNDDAITLVGLAPTSHISPEMLQKKIQQSHSFEICSWKNLYPALMETLHLQKKISNLLILFILFLSCSTIASLIFMHIQHKWYDFALMITLGASQKSITFLIMLMTFYITVPSIITGLGAAAIAGTLIDHYALFTLSDEFIFSHIPVHFEAYHFYGTFFVIILVTLLTGWLCARSAHSIQSTTLLRFKE